MTHLIVLGATMAGAALAGSVEVMGGVCLGWFACCGADAWRRIMEGDL